MAFTSLSSPPGTLYLKLLGVEGLLDYNYLMALSGPDSSPPRTYSAGTTALLDQFLYHSTRSLRLPSIIA